MAGSPREMDNDELILTLLGVFGLGALIMNWGSVWASVVGWLVGRGILVTAAVFVRVPGAGGAGLDTSRLAIALAILLLLLAGAVGWGTKARNRTKTVD
jgi:hypothetical protein